jgi:hypothetical protein
LDQCDPAKTALVVLSAVYKDIWKMAKKEAAAYTATDFFLEDFSRTLFPLTTNRIIVERGSAELLDYSRKLTEGDGSFLPQRRVYANKDELHLRRTVKLDPVAEFYLYDLVFRNRGRFRKPHSNLRSHFGYRFANGRPLPPSKSYSDFRKSVFDHHIMSEEFISCDISGYFNHVYHHDLAAWFAALEPTRQSDVEGFGKYLREINAGRSLDCLPQGLYPAKMIGNDFLRFVEESSSIRAPRVARFMDDIVLLGDKEKDLMADFSELQRLLGLKGLTINANKTRFGGTPITGEVDEHLTELKKELLRLRRGIVIQGYEGDEDADSESEPLQEEQIQLMLDLLKSGALGEDDAELIMVVMRDHVSLIEEHLPIFANGYPHLAKNYYSLCRAAEDKGAVAEIVLEVAKGGTHIGEYQLFWFGSMLEEYLLDTSRASDIIHALYSHPSASEISKAKILEIDDRRYGLPEMREAFLREGRSDWLAWASAVGSRGMKKQARNYLLTYFSNGSSMNKLIADIMQK